MPLVNPEVSSLAGPLGFFGKTPIGQPSGPVGTISYTATPLGSAFTGGLLDLLQAARLSDLNATRLAVENVRAMTESQWARVQLIEAMLRNLGLMS